MIFTGLFGNETAAKVLLYLCKLNSGYPRGIANALHLPASQVQRQLEKLELEGILASRLVGKTRIYEWNPRCGYLSELKLLLERGHELLPEAIQEKYFTERRRPRKAGKTLSK